MRRLSSLILALTLLLCAPSLWSQLPQPDGGPFRRGILPRTWATGGPRCMEMPEWQIHEYNPDFFILRQSGCTDYEKPFVYLLFGKDRALLFDTGSRKGNLAPTLQHTVHQWLERNARAAIPLVVTHSHSHSDHVAGDKEIQALNDPAMPVTFVAATVDATKAFYKVTNWPEDSGTVDLGDRLLDLIPIPGHDTVSVALYDRQTAVLLTGDSVYPGRIYIRDLPAFTRSNQRLLRFARDKTIAHILGCHIEEARTPFLDYPVGTLFQPDEHELSLSRGILSEIEDGLASMQGAPRRIAFADLSLWPVGPTFRMSDKTEDVFEKTQKQQLSHKWDQTLP